MLELQPGGYYVSERGGELVDEWVVDRIRKAGCHERLANRRISGRVDERTSGWMKVSASS